VIEETDLKLTDGRTLHCYDSGEAGGLTIFWHHGSPNTGDAAAVADALGVGQFAVLGHSGGGSHALACGALLPGRVLAVAEGSGLAPFGADGLDWFAGMTATGAAEIRAAVEGSEALERYLASHEFDMEQFTPADQTALQGTGPGWPPAARTRSCGARTTDTSRSSARAEWRPWTGWWPGPEGRSPLSPAEPVSPPRCAAGVAG
jgi:pimeloyl-ACP methyl ester carboxylesterase